MDKQNWLLIGVIALFVLFIFFRKGKETFMSLFDKQHQWAHSHEIQGLRPGHDMLLQKAEKRKYGGCDGKDFDCN